MRNIAKAVGILIAGSTAFACIRPVVTAFVTGTSVSENMMTYLVPLAIAVFTFLAVFCLWAKKKPPRSF